MVSPATRAAAPSAARPAIRASTSPQRPTSLTEWLRGRGDAELAQLLRRRPDLGLPAPADFATLASRVSVRTSLQRAVDGLNAWALRVLEAAVLGTDEEGDLDLARIADLLAPTDPRNALDELRELALIWGDSAELHLVAGVRDSLGPYPAGLGRPTDVLFRTVSEVTLAPVLRTLGLGPASQPTAGNAIARRLSSPSELDSLLEMADEAERDVLKRLAAGPPVGLVRDAQAPPDPNDPAPARRLLARALLTPIDARTVELPRAVALHLRGPHPLAGVAAEPPAIIASDRAPREADRIGTTAVLTVLRLVEALAETWSRQPAIMLRAGGIGVRELRRTAKDIGEDEATIALMIEMASSAGLIGPTTGIEPTYLPTSDYDNWLRREPAQRWSPLAAAWLGMSRQPSLVGQRDERERVITALGPDAERGTLPALRRTVFNVLISMPPGAAPTSPAAVLDRLAWEAPRRAAAQRASVEAVLLEAELVGITAAGGLTGYSRALLAGSMSATEDALTIALPVPVDHFLWCRSHPLLPSNFGISC